MTRRRVTVLATVVGMTAGALGLGGWALAQSGWGAAPDALGWQRDAEHPEDVFTFVRIKYDSHGRRGRRGWGRGGGSWDTDMPESDNNLSLRLQQLTSLKVNPEPLVLELSDPRLFDYPFIYIVEPGRMSLFEEEVETLRQYLLGGGFLMFDDFWGEDDWDNVYKEMKRVFPDREPVDLPVTHPIFSAVFPLDKKPQIPSIHHWYRTGLSYERFDAEEPHYQAYLDDDGRIMALACHNTDLGDGWEREGEDAEYFRTFSEAQAYPMGINIIFYAMTH